MLDYQNGCVLPETMVIYSKFHNNPHVHLLQMSSEDSGLELVSVGFMHYEKDLMVHFSSESDVGEVWELHEGLGEQSGYVPYGMIEVDQLEDLLGRLPHIDHFLFKCEAVRH